MQLGRRLAPTVLRPVHAVGNQSNRRRVDAVNGLLESARQPLVTPRRTEARELVLQMLEHLPGQRLHHVRVAAFVRMRESVAARRGRPAHSQELRTVVAQSVTQIVQPRAMNQVAVKQAHDMTPRRKSPALSVHPILGGQTANHPDRDELAKLIKDDRTVLGWFWLVFFHHDFLGRKSARANHFFKFLAHPYGMAVKRFDLLLWSKANISVSWVRGCLPTARRNPVGQSILSRYFEGDISPLKLPLTVWIGKKFGVQLMP